MLWFYFQRQDSPRPRKPERQICDEFLNTRFARVKTQQEIFMRLPQGGYSKEPRISQFPRAVPTSPLARGVYAALDEGAPLHATLAKLGIQPSFFKLSLLRLGLATSGRPFLEAV
jgi:hypothetical protein